MRPYLREKNIKGQNWKRDAHPLKGLINWWEDLDNETSRRTIKQRLARETGEELTIKE